MEYAGWSLDDEDPFCVVYFGRAISTTKILLTNLQLHSSEREAVLIVRTSYAPFHEAELHTDVEPIMRLDAWCWTILTISPGHLDPTQSGASEEQQRLEVFCSHYMLKSQRCKRR